MSRKAQTPPFFNGSLEDWEARQGEIDRKLHELDHDAAHQIKARQQWFDRGCQDLEPALRSGAIALLDARWLVNFAASSQDAVMLCRQELELTPEALLSCEQVIASTPRHGFGGIHIIVLSYMWLHPSHPDPKGSTLQLLAEWCRSAFRKNWGLDCPRWGVFWDYASLYQHPDKERGILRTEQEEKLFREGLRASSEFYSHSKTTCFMVTKFPQNYPEGYDLPAGANCGEYDQRGWPLVESCLATLVKDRSNVYDISQEDAGRGSTFFRKTKQVAPLTPERLWERLQTASFTNAKADRPLVLELYRAQFVKQFGQTKKMSFHCLEWDDEQIVNLAEIIGAGYCPQIRKLSLFGNCFGVEGCRALASALSRPMAPQLTTVGLGSKTATFGDEGIRILSEHLVQIEEVHLWDAELGVGACQALNEAASKRGTMGVKMRKLRLDGNDQIGDEGVDWLAPLFMQHLEYVSLRRCHVGDAGCQALATAAAQYAPCPLKRLDLRMNPGISEAGCLAHIGKLVQFCLHLELFFLDKRLTESHRVMRVLNANKAKTARILRGWDMA